MLSLTNFLLEPIVDKIHKIHKKALLLLLSVFHPGGHFCKWPTELKGILINYKHLYG